jgi:hypothetical protein
MSSGYTVNGTDLDAIFKPRYSAKRANVNISASGTDISDIYEKTQVPEDKISFDTNIKSNQVDLKNIFAAISYKKLSFSYYTVGESYDRYRRANDGQIYITILQANYNESGIHNVTAQVGSTLQTAAFTTDSYTFSFLSQDQAAFPKSVTVTDTNSGKTNTFTISTLGAAGVTSAVTTVNVY